MASEGGLTVPSECKSDAAHAPPTMGWWAGEFAGLSGYADGFRLSAPVTTEDIEQITAAMNSVRSIVRALRISSRMIEGKMGISGAQLFVMQQLADKPANSLNELADRTATHQSSVSVVVRRLVDHGYVTRTTSDADRRRVELALTDKGRNTLAGAPVTVQVKLLAGARALSAEQRKALGSVLQAWVRAAGIEDSSPPLLGEELAGDGK